MEKQAITRYGILALWQSPLLLAFGFALQDPLQGRNPVFLLLGLAAAFLQASRTLTGTGGREDVRARLALLLTGTSADLLTLLVIQYGLLQTRTELERGNGLGAAVSLIVVTPITCLVSRAILKAVGRELSAR